MKFGIALLWVVPALLPAQQLAIAQYGSPVGNLTGITAGPDGAMWFTGYGLPAESVGRIDRAGATTTYPATNANGVAGITTGPDGALWFAGGLYIGRITTAGVMTHYALPSGSIGASGITAGPDGALWFTESTNFQIGRITTAGAITMFPVSNQNGFPSGIAAGPDGALWFTEWDGPGIGRITTSGAVTTYPLPTANAYPSAIVRGPDGALWFTEFGSGKIGRITTAGAITEFPTTVENPQGITPGADGALWFTGSMNQIGRITTAGAIAGYPVPAAPNVNSQPAAIAAAPDGTLWFVEYGVSRIGEVVFPTAAFGADPASGYYGSNLTFAGSGFASNEKVRIFRDGIGSALLATGTADAGGSFTASASAPESPYGPRTFLALGETSGNLGAAGFSIEPRLVLNADSGMPGSTATVAGYGFDWEPVSIYWGNPATLLGYAYAGVEGSFHGSADLQFTVPRGAAAGANGIVVRGEFSGLVVRAAFTVR
ncbi:MAG: hypothetical protein ABSC93_20555 [Bryobacteraceae bacterium]